MKYERKKSIWKQSQLRKKVAVEVYTKFGKKGKKCTCVNIYFCRFRKKEQSSVNHKNQIMFSSQNELVNITKIVNE